MKRYVWPLAVLVIILCGSARGDWPMYGHDPAQTFFTEEAVAPPLGVDWVLGAGTVNSAVADEKNLYVSLEPHGQGGGCWLVSLSRATGQPNWIVADPRARYGVPRGALVLALQGERLYVCFLHGVCALKKSDARVLWFKETGEETPLQVLPDGDDLYVSTFHQAPQHGEYRVLCLEVSSGQERWRSTYGSMVACVSPTAVYTVSDRLYRLDKQTGHAGWWYYGATEARFVDGLIYTARGVLNEKGELLLPADPSSRMAYTPESRIWSELIGGPRGSVQAGGGSRLYSVAGTDLVAWDRDRDSVVWRSKVPVSKIALAGQWIYASSSGPGGWSWRVSAFSVSTGKREWEYRPPMGYYPGVDNWRWAPVVTADAICALGAREIYCFSHRPRRSRKEEANLVVRGVIEIDGKSRRTSLLVRNGIPFLPLGIVYDGLGYRYAYSSAQGLVVKPSHPDLSRVRASYRIPLKPKQDTPPNNNFPYNWSFWTGYGGDERLPKSGPIFRGGQVFVPLHRVPLMNGITIWNPVCHRVTIVTLDSAQVRRLSEANLNSSVREGGFRSIEVFRGGGTAG